VFSIEANKDGILFISKKKGRNKKVNILKGGEYDDMSIAVLV